MYKQKIILRYVLLFIIILIISVSGYLLIKVLNTENNVDSELYGAESKPLFTEVQPVFKNNTYQNGDVERYSKNIFVHIINSIIPSAKASYEKSHGCNMQSIISVAVSNIANAASLNISDPRTYFRFVHSAFGQYDPAMAAAFNESEAKGLPDITNFEDVPEGTIIFDNELDEFYAEQGEGIEVIASETDVSIDPNIQASTAADANISEPDKIALSKKSPEILIYHTHTTECYMPVTTGNSHTMDEKVNIVSIGKIMADALMKKYNYKVIHDKTYHDTESYAYSYINSLLTVKEQLKKNQSLEIVMDLHRDAFPTGTNAEVLSQRKKDYTVKINGKSAARVMLVVGMDNENYKELEKFAVYIKKKMEKLYPGLLFKIDRAKGRKYNQFYSDYSILVEMGCNLNTIEEAKYSAELMGHVMGEVLEDLKK